MNNTTGGSFNGARAESRRHSDELVAAIVTYNSGEYLERLTTSIPEWGGPFRVRPLVVDNASSDDTVAVARSLGLEIVEAGGNFGYSAAINLARSRAVGSYLLVLNPDLFLAEGAIDRLVAAFDSDEVGIAIPRLTDGEGEWYPHLRREPSLWGALGDAVFGAKWPGRPQLLTDRLLHESDYRQDRDVAWGGGAALLISAACSEAVGEWSADRYFLYAEETDYQRRARNAGFRVRYVSGAQVVHEGGGSGTSPQLLALMSVNRIRYFRSFHGPLPSAAYRGAVAVGHLLRARNPDHRAALMTVLDAGRWSDLPGPTKSEPESAPAPVRTDGQERSGPVASLCLHGVGEPQRALEAGEERFWIEAEVLTEVLDLVVQHPAEVELTVDDSNASDFEHILPALRERGLSATFFVITDRIDTPGSLSTAQIRELHDSGMTIGTHGATHLPWRDLGREALDAELRESMGRLTAITGERVRYAACPRGSYDRGVLASLRRFGIERVYTVDGGGTRAAAWARSRYTITRHDTADTIRAWLDRPAGDLREQLTRSGRSAVKRWR